MFVFIEGASPWEYIVVERPGLFHFVALRPNTVQIPRKNGGYFLGKREG